MLDVNFNYHLKPDFDEKVLIIFLHPADYHF